MTYRWARTRSLLLAGAVTLGTVVAVAHPAAAVDAVTRPPDGVLQFDGRGFGHGRGMSQHGAYGAALQGLNHAQILGFYYSDTTLVSESGISRRVLLTGEDADAVVTNAAGLVLRNQASGATLRIGDDAGVSRVRARPAGGSLLVEGLRGGAWQALWPGVSGPVHFEGRPTQQLHHPAGLRTYRGTLTAALSGQAARPLYVVNRVGLDDYVRGVVAAEMPSSWHLEALKAQSVAARSYGRQPCPQPRSYPATSLYDVIDTTACQVYRGVTAETTRTNQAVADTAGQVLRYAGAVLRTEFSSANGGWTVANGGAFVAKQDPYDAVGASAARSTVHRWTGVRVPVSALEKSFGTGLLRSVRVLERNGHGEWGGRVLRVRLVGDARTVDVTGEQLRSAAGLRSSWFDLFSPVDAKHLALGGDTGLLGPPTGPEGILPGGRWRPYRNGSIYWTLQHGAYEVHGAVLSTYARLRWETGPLGYPVTDELGTPDGIGRYNAFQGGSIYWTSPTGAHEVRGAIRQTWARLGWERSALGYPVTDELLTPGGVGRFNHFQVGSIYWTSRTGAHEVRGAIRDRWAAMGWERSRLGYPVSDEYAVPGGRRSDFQGGSIVWDARTGITSVI